MVGDDVMERIAETKVIIFGLGGVGSWCAEGLVRSGIRHLTIVDMDTVSANNRGWQVVEAEVPIGEMSSYAIDLRSMTQGRGSYALKFVRYEEVPQMNQAKIIEDAKKDEEE